RVVVGTRAAPDSKGEPCRPAKERLPMIPRFLAPEIYPYASVEIVSAPTKLVCAWCTAVLREGGLPASHGCCPACSAQMLGDTPVSEVERTIEEHQRRGQALKAALLVLLIVLLAPTAAAAQSWPLSLAPYVAVGVGQGRDLLLTIHTNPARGCVETNTLGFGGPHPSVLRVAIPKLAIIGGVALLLR